MDNGRVFDQPADLMVFGVLLLISVILVFWQWAGAWRYPLNQRSEIRTNSPGITVLKPLHGCDIHTRTCLASWFEQAYDGPVQLLFGVDSEEDPVCEVVRDLQTMHRHIDSRLVICRSLLGANAKVSKLAELTLQARHPLLVVSDADVRIPTDLLGQLVITLQDGNFILAHCFYRLANPATLAMRWEAVAINADFWSQVLQSRVLGPIDFAMGAVMALPRHCLETIGGWKSMVNHLADDYQLGNRVVKQGGHVRLCPIVVECWSHPMGWLEVWQHQLRWARTTRVCKPGPYAWSLLNNVTLWSALWLAWTPHPPVLALTILGLAIRVLTALDLQRRLAPATFKWRHFAIVIVKDLFQAALWLLAFSGNHVRWRGQTYRVQNDGRLVSA